MHVKYQNSNFSLFLVTTPCQRKNMRTVFSCVFATDCVHFGTCMMCQMVMMRVWQHNDYMVMRRFTSIDPKGLLHPSSLQCQTKREKKRKKKSLLPHMRDVLVCIPLYSIMETMWMHSEYQISGTSANQMQRNLIKLLPSLQAPDIGKLTPS